MADVLQVKVPFDGTPEKEIPVTAYAFDKQGKLLATAPVSGGQAKLALSAQQAATARIFVAPTRPEAARKEAPSLQSLQRLHAYEPTFKVDPKSAIQQIGPIPEAIWKLWLFCKCHVRGHVVRPVSVGGQHRDLPICRARVHICDVEAIFRIIPRLPDLTIFKLRDELVAAVEHPVHPIPLPDPPPFKFDTSVVDPSPANIAVMNGALPAGQQISKIQTRAAVINPAITAALAKPLIAAAATHPATPATAVSALKPEIRTRLVSTSPTVVKQALIDNVNLILPHLCLWEWFWFWFTCEEIATLETNDQGAFETDFWYLCVDPPDLYFWVEYFIGGVWTKVYHPPIPCNTFWDYKCGTEVTIHVTDPRVPPCQDEPDLPGLEVAILSIGNDISMHQIQGSSAGASEGLITGGNPFGGVLEPHVWFSRTNLFAAGITRYRWSYRQLTSGDGTTAVSDTFHHMDRRVIRHYVVDDPVTHALSFPTDQMGPDPGFPGQDLFRIQPAAPPPPGIEWTGFIDAREDSATAFFETHLLQGGNAATSAGKYELKLELFKTDGSLVDLTTAGVILKVATTDAPFGTQTVNTRTLDAGPASPDAQYLFKNGAGHVVGFRLVVRVDNNPCQAVINPLTGAGLTPDEDCGFLRYLNGATLAHISFKARHPHDFATFSFTTFRGTSKFVAEACAPATLGGSAPVGSSPVNGFVRDASSVFSKDVSVTTLLTSNSDHACTKGAFAENLYVAATATDGWSRLSYLDASGLPVAYALEPNS